MANTVYAVQIGLDSIFTRDAGDGSSKGDVYFLAEVGGKRSGRSPKFAARPNSTIDLTGKGFA